MTTEKKENPFLNVYLGSLKEPWVNYCEARGLKPGAALKAAISAELAKADQKPEPKTFTQAGEVPAKEPKVRFEILLTQSERAAIRERANLERCSQRRWVIDAIRAGLTKEPQFGIGEIEALGESNYQLLAIGRNLNQVAKAMHEGRRDSVTVESIQRLTAIIDKHTETVADAIRASLERWNLE